MIVAPSGAIFNYGASKQYNKRGSMDNIKSNKLNTHFYRGAENHNPKPSKHNTKLNKHNNKPVNAIFIIALSLFGLTSLSALTLLSSNSHADTTSATASVTVPDTCYLSSNIESGHEHTDTLSGGEYKANIGETTVSVVCNDRNGYSVYAIGCSGSDATNCSDANKTKLIGASTNLTIPTGLSTDGSTSNWAMKLTPVTGSFAPTILNGYNNYSLVPATATKVATLTSDINVSNSSQFKTTYAVAIASSQAADTYVGKVKYTVVHPNYTNSDGTIPTYAVTLGIGANTSSIIIDGTTYTSSSATPNLEYGTHTISGTYPTGYEFSSWSSTGNINIADSTSASTTINVTGAGTLTLAGQKQVVTFAKAYAAAGKTQTSGYYKMQDMTGSICSSVTDGQSDTLRGTRASGINYTVAKIGSLCWMTRNLDLPGGTKITNSDSNITASSYTLPASSTSGFSDNSTAYVYNSDSTNFNDTSCGSNNPCYSYYSYVAATAGTNPSSGAAGSDICPYGWRLPTQAELTTLKNSYSTGAKLVDSPFLGVYAGSYRNSSSFLNGGSYGYYWSSTAYNSNGAYYLYFDSSSANVGSTNKRYGSSVRCVAKS